MNWVRLSLEDVLAVHGEAVNAGVRDLTLLASAVDKPWASYMGNERYPSLEDKAAALLSGIARNHAFHDGNKRTAIGSCLLFLMANGHQLYFSSDEELADFVEAVATGALEHEHASEWIRLHLDPMMALPASAVEIGPQFEQWPDEEVSARVFASTQGEPTPETALGTATLWLTALNALPEYETAVRALSYDPEVWGDYSGISTELEEFHPLQDVEDSEDPDVRFVRLIPHAPHSSRSLLTAPVEEMYFLTMVRPSGANHWLVWGAHFNHHPTAEQVRGLD